MTAVALAACAARAISFNRHSFALPSLQNPIGRSPMQPLKTRNTHYIKHQKATFLASSYPVISVDAKKKELIGVFKANGRAWCKKAIEVNEYRFGSMAECVATPYGIYDLAVNKGYVYVGTSCSSAQFAVTAIRRWWEDEGRRIYAGAKQVLILADGGGSNGARSRALKTHLQTQLCDAFGMTVTACHYPPGCSKYNPIERKLFAPISINWSGKPLRSLDQMLGYIRGTITQRGLTVEASLLEGEFPRREVISMREFNELSIQPHVVCSQWNYTISPRR